MDACQSWVRDNVVATCQCMDKKGLFLFLLRPALCLFCYCESAPGRRLNHCAVFFLFLLQTEYTVLTYLSPFRTVFCEWLANMPCTVFFLSGLGWPVVVSKHMAMNTWMHRQRHGYSICCHRKQLPGGGFFTMIVLLTFPRYAGLRNCL